MMLTKAQSQSSQRAFILGAASATVVLPVVPICWMVIDETAQAVTAASAQESPAQRESTIAALEASPAPTISISPVTR